MTDLKNTWVLGEQYAHTDQNAVANAVNASTTALAVLGSNAKSASVATAESTSFTSYTLLATTTDQVTVTIGASGVALVVISANILSASWAASMSYDVSGANTISATDAKSFQFWSNQVNQTSALSGVFLETGLTPGSTTFKAKYRSNSAAGTQTFSNRRIAVVPLP